MKKSFPPAPSSPGGCCQPRFHPPSRNRKKAFKVMVVNCNGLKGSAKKLSFHAAISHHTLDFVFGCESKLDDSLFSYSIFQSNYSIYRKDKNIHGGGDCEIQWCNVQFANAKPLYSASQKKVNRELSMFYHNLITILLSLDATHMIHISRMSD